MILDCSLDENVRRLASLDRRHRKMVDPDPLIEWRSKYTLLTDASTPSLRIDNTSRRPDDVADDVVSFANGMIA